ncbi:hypothetical protein [Globicatella sanguinis]|uniref:hypothetical protein n=1 Tax=Globicatella sanguinis TaxID=13076 RepID=UPI000825A485|nr:hypothetical protein [Globicatella sanguinis]
MEIITDILTGIQDHLVAVIVTSAFTIGGWLLNKAIGVLKDHLRLKREAMEHESTEQDLIKQGVLALLRFRVNRLCASIKQKGYMTIDEKLDLVDIYSSYELLGGNSRTHLIYEDVMSKYDVKEEEK